MNAEGYGLRKELSDFSIGFGISRIDIWYNEPDKRSGTWIEQSWGDTLHKTYQVEVIP